uniref:NADH-ubiquinone oxidoreductase chain 2 n=1 Tax=Argopistes tsekooni TaxID=2016140 RepID=A0A6C0PSL5_9CUCU|nr:NADH dehydrogenase subunit 2 [Argopistes tsekooni]QHX99898.1 NADH dehydrogenase subunit 2 [Argopistes tsekooni]
MWKLYKILFFNILIMSTLISISAYSWFSMWIGLEINLLSIIPLLKSNKNIFPAEASLKYFITQTLASIIILFSIIESMYISEYISSNHNYWLMMMMNSALLTKMGAAPFHSWFPEVVEGLNWMNNFILLTWQKLAPMVLIMYNLNMYFFLSIIIILSSVISGIMGINQISLRKILAYSSINHIAWMLASMMNLKMNWFIYFVIYSLINLNIIFMFYSLNIFFISQLLISLSQNKLIKMIFILNFFSLGGLPPFLGFLPKWITIQNLSFNNFYMLSFILIIFTLITLFFYIRLSITTLTFSMQETIIKTNKINNYTMIFLNMFNILGIFICTNLFNIL